MVTPRLEILDDLEEEVSDLKQRRANMWQTGRLIEVDSSTGECTVLLHGKRFVDQVRKTGIGSLVDSPEQYIGLTVMLLFESGVISHGAWMLGPAGLIGPLSGTTSLDAGTGPDLEARDRRVLPDSQPAWTGEATVKAGRAVVINSVRLVFNQVQDGTGVMIFTSPTRQVVFREVLNERDSVIMVLRPRDPFTVIAEDADITFGMSLEVDRTANGLLDFDDGVLEVPYVTGSQPDTQRLKLDTLSGAGLPNFEILGRTG